MVIKKKHYTFYLLIIFSIIIICIICITLNKIFNIEINIFIFRFDLVSGFVIFTIRR